MYFDFQHSAAVEGAALQHGNAGRTVPLLVPVYVGVDKVESLETCASDQCQYK